MKTNAQRVGQPPLIRSDRTATAKRPAHKTQPTRDLSISANREHNIDKAHYRPTAREQIALDKHAARRDVKAPAPRLKVQHDGNSKLLSFDHPDYLTAGELLMAALGSADVDFVEGLVNQLVEVSSPRGDLSERQLNFALSTIKDIKPTDHLEAMLAAQMALVHMTSMSLGWRFAKAVTPSERESAAREINRATRTFIGQLEALKRYRSGAEQRVTVQQVSVSEGGQAIVGNVTQSPREGTPEHPTKPMPVLPDARQPPMEMVGKSEAAPVPLRRRRDDDGRSST